jgi:hypothetical protein
MTPVAQTKSVQTDLVRATDHLKAVNSWFTTSPHTSRAPAPKAVLDNIQHGYNDLFSCPLTPFENRLQVAIRAGEKVFPGTGHEESASF